MKHFTLLLATAFFALPSITSAFLPSTSTSSSSHLFGGDGIDYDMDYSRSDDRDTDEFNAVVTSHSRNDSKAVATSLLKDLPSSSPPLSTTNSAKTTIIYGIRHGVSLSNEWMAREENTWGVPTYRDDNGNPRDSPLSPAGEQQAAALAKSLQADPPSWLDDIELVVVSPMTRCLQTFQLAVQPALKRDIPVLAHPLAAERVYTVSETGRPVSELQQDFGNNGVFDFSHCHRHHPWWYDPSVETEFNRDIPWYEWRPHEQGQQYGAPGEPMKVFQRRMDALQDYLLHERPEQHILVTAHWGVLRHFTGEEMDNCQVCRIELSASPVADAALVSSSDGSTS